MSEVAAITHEIMTHLATEENPTLEKSLQAQALGPECQSAARTVG